MAQLDARPTGDQEASGSTPAEVGNIHSWSVLRTFIILSWNIFYGHSLLSPFRCFKKGSYQFLAKECAQYFLTA